jgi:hypothetical protein
LFLDYDGRRLTVPQRIDAAWFAGLQADWERSAPILQGEDDEFPCPVRFDFSVSPPDGTGWSVPEQQPDGSFRMWMAGDRASLRLPTRCAGAVAVSLHVVGAMAEDIVEGLELRVDGQRVALQARPRGGGSRELTGVFNAPPGPKRVLLELSVPRTIVPDGGDRTLAVMLAGVTIGGEPVHP